MKKYILALALLLSAICVQAQTGNTFHVSQFMTAQNSAMTVGQAVGLAQQQCNSNTVIPCYIVIDPMLAAYAAGVMPAKCTQCVIEDYRSTFSSPFGIGSPIQLNIMAGGAKCDGVTVDSAIVQAAIDANPGAEFDVPPGVTCNFGTVGIVLGNGQIFDAHNSTIKYSGAGIAILAQYAKFAHVRNVTLDMTGSTAGAAGIILDSTWHSTIEGCSVKHGPAGYPGLGFTTSVHAWDSIANVIDASFTDGYIAEVGTAGTPNALVSTSTVSNTYCKAASQASCYVLSYALNPVFINATAEGWTTNAYSISYTAGTIVIKGSDIEGAGTNVFAYGAGNSLLGIDASISLSGWSGSSANFSTGPPPSQGQIITDNANLGTVFYSAIGTPLRVTNYTTYGASSGQYVEVGAANDSAVDAGKPFKYQWSVTGSNTGQQLSLLQCVKGSPDVCTALFTTTTGSLIFPSESTFNTCTMTDATTSAVAVGCRTYLANAHTLKRLLLTANTLGVTCSTAPIIDVWDYTAGAALGAQVTLANGASTADSGAVSIAMTAAHVYGFKVLTASSGCGTSPTFGGVITYQ